MAVAIDTNVLVYLLGGTAERAREARETLERAGARQSLHIAPIVFAELLAFPGRQPDEIDAFLGDNRISVAWDIPPHAWRRAGDAFQRYATRRRVSGGGLPRRLVADFVIGAHALDVGALITADPEFFRTNFPELRLVIHA